MLQCLIIEDEPEFVEQLGQFIARTNLLAPPLTSTTAMGALQLLANNPIDILFLDIGLPDMSGLDFIQLLPQRPAIIITSSHSDKAVDCFDLGVIDFLYKPYDYSRFLRGLSRAMMHKGPLLPAQEPKKETTNDRDMVFFKSGRRMERFRYDDIQYIEAYGIYSKVHTLNGTVAITRRISTVLDTLTQEQFIRIHKSYIVNLAYLKRLELKHMWVNEHKLPIGITYRPMVQQKMTQLGIKERDN